MKGTYFDYKYCITAIGYNVHIWSQEKNTSLTKNKPMLNAVNNYTALQLLTQSINTNFKLCTFTNGGSFTIIDQTLM